MTPHPNEAIALYGKDDNFVNNRMLADDEGS